MSRRFLITGGAGFIGSAVVRDIIDNTDGCVLVVDKLTYAASLDTLARVSHDPRYAFLRADICDAARMQEIVASFRPDTIMHLAAESHVDRSIEGPGEFIQTNVVGTFVLLQAALSYWRSLSADARDRFRFHHVSTDEVFGSLGHQGAFNEASAHRPTSPYSASKASSDHLVNAWRHTYGLPTVITYSSNNYGPWQFPEKFIPLLIINAIEGKPLPVYGNGENVRDWLHVEDHARALLSVTTGGRVGDTYCIGGVSERTNIDVARSICAAMDELAPRAGTRHESLIAFVPDRPGHDFRYAIDPAKVMLELGWQPREAFNSGLRKTVQWYLDNAAWWQRIRANRYDGRRLGIVA